ncbi:MAG: hypothetical protein ACOX6T_27645 [Myxococcales bacterium]|jgi:hypothetical protein
MPLHGVPGTLTGGMHSSRFSLAHAQVPQFSHGSPGAATSGPQPPQALLTPSSVVPSQSLSSPSQDSSRGWTSPTQAPQVPAAQVWVPWRQMPTPAVASGPV